MVKKEATRSNTELKGKYMTSGKKDEGKPFGNIYLDGKQQVYDDYNNLITKQFAQFLTQLNKELEEIRSHVSKEIKNKNVSEIPPKINQQREKLK